MAPKRSTLLDVPPAASSEEDEASGSKEEEDSEEDTSSSSEEQKTQKSEKKLPPSQLQTQTSRADGKASRQVESETETETESDSGDDGPISNVKPKTNASTVKTNAKRDNEVESEAKDAKRVKRDSDSNGTIENSENGKKQLFQRLWSEEDEIVVLKGMVTFAEKKGKDPMKDMNMFCDYIKKNLHVNVSLTQVKDKVSRLKKRFDNHISKGKKGEEKTFSKAHEQKLFDLSRKIWGSSGICSNANGKTLAALKEELGVGSQKCTEKAAAEDIASENHLGMSKFVDYVGMEEFVMKRGPETVDGAKKSEMQGKWRDLHVAELELFVMRNALLSEQAELMLAAYKSMES